MVAARTILAVVLLASLARTAAADSSAVTEAAGQLPRADACKEWRECRQQALAAADRGDYEAFHDLAWRAVQTGPSKDPALMYLLARAQALSGRPHDALVMLQRLAEMGVASDAAINDDFSRTRQLPGWAEVSALIARLPGAPSPSAAASAVPSGSPGVSPGVSPGASPNAAPGAAPPTAARTSSSSDAVSGASATPGASRPAAPVAAAAPSTSAASTASALPIPSASKPALEALRFSTGGFTPGGLAYDAVSKRFLVGDRLGRKLIVVGDGSNHAVDFVRADSAGFHEISAVEIDARRGDLWVASAVPADGSVALHKLQLVSGRPLRSFPLAADLGAAIPVDLAVTAAGAVLVLDGSGRQLLMLPAGGTTLERVLRIDAEEPVSVAAADEDGVAYVAHRDGVLRIDLRARTATRVTAAGSVSLAHLERIRWYRRALIAVRLDDDGSRHIVRLELNASGRAVSRATTLDASVPPSGQTFVTISGDDLVYLVDDSHRSGDLPRGDAPGMTEFVAYRVPLR